MPSRPLLTLLQRFLSLDTLDKIGVDQVEAVRSAAPIIVLGNVVNGSILLWALYGVVPLAFLSAWMAALFLLNLNVLHRWLCGFRKQRRMSSRRRIGLMTLNAALFAGPWVVLEIAWLGSLPPHVEHILIAVVAGMAAGGAVFLAPLYPAAMVYVLAILVPFGVKAMTLDVQYLPLAALSVSYCTFLLATVCWSAHQNLEQSDTNRQLSQQKDILQVIIDHFPGGLTLKDRDNKVLLSNDRGLTPPLGHAVSMAPAAADDVREYSTGDASIEVRSKRLFDQSLLVVSLDVTDRRRAERALRHLAQTDPLTELPNRSAFYDHLRAMLGEPSPKLALLSLDLDRFKEINDTLGHPVGDSLLITVAKLIRACVRQNDLVARLGGDEFCVIIASDDPAQSAAMLSQRIHAKLAQPIDLGEHVVTIGVSIGIATCVERTIDDVELARQADLALLAAKDAGKGRYRFYEVSLDERLSRRRLIEEALRTAIDNGEFHMVYQPIMDVASGRISCFEALLRWTNPALGAVSPDEFISVAEDTGLIVAIGRWVLLEACAAASHWPAGIRVAVNISPCQFKDESLFDAIRRALSTASLDAHRLEVEVTETAMLSAEASVFDLLHSIKTLGVRVALDDFGTGHSCLANLKCFPFNKIKIDRAFVIDLRRDDPLAISFVKLLASLGLSLDVSTTAEGVETLEQYDIVRAAGCTEIQGYLISKPLLPDAIAPYLAAHSQDWRSASAA